MKLLKNKIFLVLMLCLTVLAGAFYFVSPTQKVSAANDYTLTVQKVDIKIKTDSKQKDIFVLDGDYVECTDENYKPQDLLKDNVTMLLNSEPIVIDADGDDTTTDDISYYRQYIKVSFTATEDTTLQFLEVNATLNGIAIDTKEVTGETSSSNHSYTQYFDLTDIKQK